MQPARKNDPNPNDTLPDPLLNPMINPRLGNNLGRWAKVYYTTPPEKRDQAVLELVRELEGGAVPNAETEQPVPDENELPQSLAATPLDNPLGPISATPEQRFCGHCGSPLKTKALGKPHATGPLLAAEPSKLEIEDAAHQSDLLIDSESSDAADRRHRFRAHILVVLLLSTGVGAWGLWRIRFAPAPLSSARPAPTPIRIVKQTTVPPAPVIQPQPRQTASPPPPQTSHDPKLSKPSAGTPVECTSDHLSNCRTDELYRRSMRLADGIDARFLAYDKRMNQLLHEATAQNKKGARSRPDRLRQANYSAQLWEHLQLKAYTTHEKRDALKFRAELLRRASAAPKSPKNVRIAYDHPQSCLELHYIADDLRRLASRLPRPAPPPLRASARKIANNSP